MFVCLKLFDIKNKQRRDRVISLGVKDTQSSVTTAISRSNNGF